MLGNSSYNAHTNPIFTKYQILPYEILIKQSQIIFIHATHHKDAPASFRNTWENNMECAPHPNLHNASNYLILHPRTET